MDVCILAETINSSINLDAIFFQEGNLFHIPLSASSNSVSIHFASRFFLSF
ncbi:hypothetical protein HOG21_02740 [bacterium]|nr:hypothetical protein [bacterium]